MSRKQYLNNMNTRHIATLFLAAFIAIAGACSPVTTATPDEGNGTEQPGKPGTGEENPGAKRNREKETNLKKAENLAKVRTREEVRTPAKARQKRP